MNTVTRIQPKTMTQMLWMVFEVVKKLGPSTRPAICTELGVGGGDMLIKGRSYTVSHALSYLCQKGHVKIVKDDRVPVKIYAVAREMTNPASEEDETPEVTLAITDKVTIDPPSIDVPIKLRVHKLRHQDNWFYATCPDCQVEHIVGETGRPAPSEDLVIQRLKEACPAVAPTALDLLAKAGITVVVDPTMAADAPPVLLAKYPSSVTHVFTAPAVEAVPQVMLAELPGAIVQAFTTAYVAEDDETWLEREVEKLQGLRARIGIKKQAYTDLCAQLVALTEKTAHAHQEFEETKQDISHLRDPRYGKPEKIKVSLPLAPSHISASVTVPPAVLVHKEYLHTPDAPTPMTGHRLHEVWARTIGNDLEAAGLKAFARICRPWHDVVYQMRLIACAKHKPLAGRATPKWSLEEVEKYGVPAMLEIEERLVKLHGERYDYTIFYHQFKETV